MSEAMAKHSNLKVTFGMLAAGAPFFSSWAAKASRYPGQCVVQVQVRPQAFHMSHASGKNPFSESKTYREICEAANGCV